MTELLSLQGIFSGRLHQVSELSSILNNLYLQVFLIIFLTHPVNVPCGRKHEKPGKTSDFRQSVDELFPRAIRCSIQGSKPRPQWWEDVAQTTEPPKHHKLHKSKIIIAQIKSICALFPGYCGRHPICIILFESSVVATTQRAVQLYR